MRRRSRRTSRLANKAVPPDRDPVADLERTRKDPVGARRVIGSAKVRHDQTSSPYRGEASPLDSGVVHVTLRKRRPTGSRI